jgi:hypothetical protein
MSKHTQNLREAVELQDVQELEGLHLEPVAGVDHQQDQVGDLGQIRHGVDILRTLVERKPLLLACDNSDWPEDVSEVLVAVYLDQRPH